MARILTRALQRPVEVKPSRDGSTIPVTVQIGDRVHRLKAVWIGRGWPSDLEVLEGLEEPWPRDLVAIAREFSPGALEELAALDANWVDESGRAHIEGPSGLLVHLEPTPAPRRETKPRFRWSPSADQIAEYLLVRRPAVLNAGEIAKETGWSHPQVSNVLQTFDRQGWTVKTGAKRGRYAVRRFAEPAELLDAWAEHADNDDRERILAHRVLRDPMDFLRAELAPTLADTMQWAVTGWAGLEVAAPFVTAVPVLQIYVTTEATNDGRLRDVMKKTGLREVDEGARVEFWPTSELVLRLAMKKRSLPIASAPRLYADLRALGGRGEEAAAHLREELIGF